MFAQKCPGILGQFGGGTFHPSSLPEPKVGFWPQHCSGGTPPSLTGGGSTPPAFVELGFPTLLNHSNAGRIQQRISPVCPHCQRAWLGTRKCLPSIQGPFGLARHGHLLLTTTTTPHSPSACLAHPFGLPGGLPLQVKEGSRVYSVLRIDER